MKKILLLIAISLGFFSGCVKPSNRAIFIDSNKKDIQVSQDVFGVKKSYTVDEQRDVKIIKMVLSKIIFPYQKYTSDYVKFKKKDVHENIAPYIDLLRGLGQDIDQKTLYREAQKRGYALNNFVKDKGLWKVSGDCESTYLAIETYLIRFGVNPQRIFEVYCTVYADDALTTPRGGHMFGYYIGASGKDYTLEQLPYTRTMQKLMRESHYDFIEQRRADQKTSKFQPFHYKQKEDFRNGVLMELTTENE